MLTTLCLSACLSAPTGQALRRSYDSAGTRLNELGAAPSANATERETDFAASLDRDTVVAHAIGRSPALAVLAHRARALVHAARAEASLPSAELGLEAWSLPLARPYALGEADMYMVEVRQRFPAAGSPDARARATDEEAQALLVELAAEERLVAQRAAEAFADYEQAFAEQDLQEQQRALLDRMRQATRLRYTTGGAGLADAARIEVELAKAQRALARVAGDISRARSTLNAVLRRPAEAALGEPRRAPAETVRLTVTELLGRAAAHRGSTLSADARLRAAGARREAAEAEATIPEFMVGVGYWQAPQMRAGVGLSASMSLPSLWGPGSERALQAKEEEAAEQAARLSAGLDLQAEVSEAHAQLVALEAQLHVVRDQGLPAARRSRDALTAAFTTGSASLLEWVDVARSVLDLEVEVAELRGELARSVARLERAVGAPLPRTSLDQDEPK